MGPFIGALLGVLFPYVAMSFIVWDFTWVSWDMKDMHLARFCLLVASVLTGILGLGIGLDASQE